MGKTSAILRILRVDSSLLGFFALFFLFFAKSNDFQFSLGMTSPIFFLLVCMYVSNDLDDIEKDRINHPERPLPSGRLTPTEASVLFFLSLGTALLLTRFIVAPKIALGYYIFFSLTLSYRYILEYIPSLKALYVAIFAAFPGLVVWASYSRESRLLVITAATFVHILGRELCMNVADRPGDPVSYIRKFHPMHHSIVGYSLQGLALMLLTSQAHRIGEIVDLIMMAFLLLLSGVFWFKYRRYKHAITATKVEMFLATYLLL